MVTQEFSFDKGFAYVQEQITALQEFLLLVKQAQDKPTFRAYFLKGVEKLRKSGLFVIPTKQKKPLVKFKSLEEKLKANTLKPQDENGLILPPWLAVLDFETKEFDSGVSLQEIATVETRRGYHVYIFREPWFDFFKTPQAELRVGENLVTLLPGSKIIFDNQTIFYRVLTPKIYRFAELPKRIQEFIEDNLPLLPEEPKEKEVEIIRRAKITSSKPYVDIPRLVEFLMPYYRRGWRHQLVLYLSGFLAKIGIPESETKSIVWELVQRTADEEEDDRIRAVGDTYRRFTSGETIIGAEGLIKEFGLTPGDLLQFISFEKPRILPSLDGTCQFVVLKDLIFKQVKGARGKIFIGPALKNLKKLVGEKGVLFIFEHGGRMIQIQNAEDLQSIVTQTGVPIPSPASYKKYLATLLQSAPGITFCSSTGWLGGKFFAHPGVEREDVLFDQEHILVKLNLHKPLNVDKQLEILHELLSEGKLLGVLSLISLSSPFLRFFNAKPFVTIITGPSGTGKTLSSLFASSLWYQATEPLVTAHTTPTGLELLLKQLKELPILLDEGALNLSFNLETLTFFVASGRGKTRGTLNLKVNVTQFNSIVFYTSENFEIEKFVRTGTLRRCVPLVVKSWEDFTDIFNPSEIAKILNICWGAGLKFVEWFEMLPEEELQKIKEESFLTYNIFPPAGTIIQALYGTLKLASAFFKRDFKNLERRLSEIFEDLKKVFEQKRDIFSYFLEKFKDFLIRHYSCFYRDNNPIIPREIWGIIDVDEVDVLTSIFSEFCEKHGFHKKILLESLREKGILISDHDRFRSLKKIFGRTFSVYRLKLPEETQNLITNQPAEPSLTPEENLSF